jgi:hypothetical protein
MARQFAGPFHLWNKCRVAPVKSLRADVVLIDCAHGDVRMAKKRGRRKYSPGASKEVKNEMHRYKRGTAKSGRGGKVKSRKQAIAIALSKARKKGARAPRKRG